MYDIANAITVRHTLHIQHGITSPVMYSVTNAGITDIAPFLQLLFIDSFLTNLQLPLPPSYHPLGTYHGSRVPAVPPPAQLTWEFKPLNKLMDLHP